MPFEIIWSEKAVRQLKKLERPIARHIFKKVSELAEDPYRNTRKIVRSPYFRLRIGDYRVIFDIEERLLRVLILKIGHRRKIYK